MTFGLLAGRSVHVLSSRHLTVVVPAHRGATIHVRVRTVDGWSRRTSADRYTFVKPPSISSIGPTGDATKGGRRITISGDDFHAPATVMFGTVRGTSVRLATSHVLTVIAPAHVAGVVDVRVSTPYGSSRTVAAAHFTYHAPPVVTGVSPASISSTFGNNVGVHGSGFDPDTVVFSGAAQIPVYVISATSLTVQVQEVTPGTHHLTIKTPWGSAIATYTVYQAPADTLAVTPRAGGHADLTWTPPFEPYTVGSTVVRTDGSTPPAIPADGTVLGHVTGNTLTDDTVVPGTTYSYAVFEDDGHGHVSAPMTRTVTIPRDPITTIGAADLVDPPAGRPAAVDCTADQCVSVDLQGSARIYDGASWSAPVPTGASTPRPYNVSCATDSFCVSLGADGTGSAGNGHEWTALPRLTVKVSVSGLSCPITGWCVATGNQGEAAILSGGTWHLTQLGTTHHWNDVSCASTTACVAVGTDGSVADYDGTSWSNPTTPVTGMHFTGVSCPSSSWCAAIGYEANATGYVTTWTTGTGWSAPTLVDPAHRGFTIDCPADGTCITGGDGADAAALSNGVWSTPIQVDPAGGTLHVGCLSATACVGVDSIGNAATFDGATWSAPAVFDPVSGNVSDLSCVAGDDCVLVDQHGYAAVRTAGTWSAPAPVAGAVDLSAVSCATATFCLAAGRFRDSPTSQFNGFVWFDGQDWSAPEHAGAGIDYLSRVACPSDQFCVAVGEEPGPDGFTAVAQTWDGQAWSDPMVLDQHSNAPHALTCLSNTFCMAGANGVVWRWANGTWTHDFPAVNATAPIAGIACFSETSCLVASIYGDVFRWQAGVWSPDPNRGPNISGLACTSPTYCLATQGYVSLPRIADFDGSTWSATVPLPGVRPVNTSQPALPACGTTCFVATPDGRVVATSH